MFVRSTRVYLRERLSQNRLLLHQKRRGHVPGLQDRVWHQLARNRVCRFVHELGLHTHTHTHTHAHNSHPRKIQDDGRKISFGWPCISLRFVLLSSVLHYKPMPPCTEVRISEYEIKYTHECLKLNTYLSVQRTNALARTVIPKPAPPAPKTTRPCAGGARPGLTSTRTKPRVSVRVPVRFAHRHNLTKGFKDTFSVDN